MKNIKNIFAIIGIISFILSLIYSVNIYFKDTEPKSKVSKPVDSIIVSEVPKTNHSERPLPNKKVAKSSESIIDLEVSGDGNKITITQDDTAADVKINIKGDSRVYLKSSNK